MAHTAGLICWLRVWNDPFHIASDYYNKHKNPAWARGWHWILLGKDGLNTLGKVAPKSGKTNELGVAIRCRSFFPGNTKVVPNACYMLLNRWRCGEAFTNQTSKPTKNR